MVSVNFAVILFCMGLLGAGFFLLVFNVWELIREIRNPTPRPWLNEKQSK